MRLICGLLKLDSAPAGSDLLNGLIAALAVPGQTPSVRRYVNGPAALAVLDFSGDWIDEAPLPASESGIRLAADIRLDRPRDLANLLGFPASTDADTLALAAYARWGGDLSDHLDGDYSLAVWDPRAGRLTLLRDVFGLRPLCYAHVAGQVFLFASLPQGIIGSGLVSAKPDVVALGYQVLRRPGTGTGLQGVLWLPPNVALEVTTAGPAAPRRVWRPDPAQVGTWRGGSRDAAAMLRDLLDQAVASRLPSHGAVGTHISGGLDSSAVTVIAARAARTRGLRLHAYSHLDDPASHLADAGERPFIQAVLDQESDIHWAPVHLGRLDADPPFRLERLSDNALRAPDDELYAAAAAAGVEVVLSGHGGDETATYHGRAIHMGLLHAGAWRALAGDLRHRAANDRRAVWRVAAARLVGPVMPDGLLAVWRQLRGEDVSRPRIEHLSFLNRDVADAVRRSLPAASSLWSRPADRLALLTDGAVYERATVFALQAAPHGVAITYPMLDRRLVDFALTLPLALLVDAGRSREPFRTAMAGILPEPVRVREGKLVGFPDAGIKLAAAKPALLARVERLRSERAAAAFADLGAIAAALRALPDTGKPPQSVFSDALTAYIALTTAWNVARMEGGVE